MNLFFRLILTLLFLLGLVACRANGMFKTLAEQVQSEQDSGDARITVGEADNPTTSAQTTPAQATPAQTTITNADQATPTTDNQVAQRSTDDSNPNPDASPWTALRDLIETARVDNQIPGVAAAVVHGNSIDFAAGFGVRNVRTGEPVTPATLFHVGSTHKSLTAMVIATLVDDGIVAWDEPVVTYFPEFELSDPESTETVTLRHLLSMSSGIPAAAEDDFSIETAYAIDLFDLLIETPLNAAPGEQFEYSNISMAVAGYIAVLAANPELDPFDEDEEKDLFYIGYANLLQQRLLNPIGMTTATLSVEKAQANPNHAAPHIVTETGTVQAIASEDFTGDPLAPAGSLKASVLDMAAYLQAQVTQGIAPDGTRIVSTANLLETWAPQIEDSESGGNYALGWGVDQDGDITVISHEGSFDNFTALLIFVPTKAVGLVLLTNTDDPGNFFETVTDEFLVEAVAQ